MAKKVTCSFCGAPTTTSWFSDKDGHEFNFSLQKFYCCKECYAKFGNRLTSHMFRLETKFDNAKKASKGKFTRESVLALIQKYLNGELEQARKIGRLPANMAYDTFFWYNEEMGCFSVEEFDLGADIDAKSMANSAERSQNIITIPFDKNDITCIEYRIPDPLGVKVFPGTTAYSFEIRLNDEKQVTYKPAITRAAVMGSGILPGAAKKDAEEQLVCALEHFKKIIGSDLPIVKKKTFGPF